MTAGGDSTVLVGVDVGGTFTDAVVVGRHGIVLAKHPTTERQEEGVLAAVRAAFGRAGIDPNDAGRVAHGTTTATNALLERRGARVAAAFTAGHTDVLELARQQRPSLFRPREPRVEPWVRGDDIVAVEARDHPTGELTPLTEDEVRRVATATAAREPGGVAICLLHSWLDPTAEQRVAGAVRELLPDAHVVASSDLGRELREYERATTTVLDAALTPVLAPYLRRLAARSRCEDLPQPLVMRSDGTLAPLASVAAHASRALLSGPAGGLVAAAAIERGAGVEGLLCFDVGGTSCDVAVVAGGEVPRSSRRTVGGLPVQLDMADLHTIGAGGCSIIASDAGGAVRVGPRSAGSIPGPASYGRGGVDFTVTDAHLVLGHLDPAALAHWEIDLSLPAAEAAALRVGAGSAPEVAAIALDVVNTNMAEAARTVSVARGLDPAHLELVAYGGAGGLHACDVAGRIGCRTVLVPHAAGAWSAVGLAVADVADAHALTVPAGMRDSGGVDDDTAADIMRIAARCHDALGGDARIARTELVADMRYAGQSHDVAIQVAAPAQGWGSPTLTAGNLNGALDAARAEFVVAHEERFGHRLDAGVEVSRLRIAARIAGPGAAAIAPSTDQGEPTYPERMLADGTRAIDLPAGTVLVPPGWRRAGDRSGCIVLERVQAGGVTTVRRPRLPVLQRQLEGVADEMGSALVRAALSSNIREREDSSTALFTADGTLLAQAAHIPVHLGSMEHSVRAVIDAARADHADAVGAWLLNDPYLGGTHLPDITVVSPIRSDTGEVVAWCAARAHHADVGAATPGSMDPFSSTIGDEGVRIPPTPLVVDGTIDRAAIASLAARARQPQERIGDLEAQLAACRVATARVPRIVAACGGPGVWRELCDELLSWGERRARSVLAGLAGRRAHAVRPIELPGDDGPPAQVEIEVGVSVEHDTLVVDLTSAPDASPTAMNCPRAVTDAAVAWAARCILDPDLPTGAGIARVLDVRTRPGSLVHAEPPTAVAAGNVEVSSVVADAVLAALASLVGVAIADGQGTMNNVVIAGDGFSWYETVAGGQGASADADGPSAVHVAMTNTRSTPVESLESDYPFVVERAALRRGSGGAGGHRGGDGVVRRVRVLEAATLTLASQRRATAPCGAAGGQDGLPGEQLVNGEPVPGCVVMPLRPGDVLELRTPGGGGVGVP